MDHVDIVDGLLTFRWRGGQTVNVFLYGREVDCFTLGGVRVPTFAEVSASVAEYVRTADFVGMGAE